MTIKFVLLLALFLLTMVSSGLLVAGNSKDSAKKIKKCPSGQFYSNSSFLTNKPRCNMCPDKLQDCQDGQPVDRASCTKDCAKLYSSKPQSTKTTRLSTQINTKFYRSNPKSTKTTRLSTPINTKFYFSKPVPTKTTRLSINKLYDVTTTRNPSKGIFDNPTDLSSTKATSSTPHSSNKASVVAVDNTLLIWLPSGLAVLLVFALIVVLCLCWLKRRNRREDEKACTQTPPPNSKPSEPKPKVTGGAASATTDAQEQEPNNPLKPPMQETSCSQKR